MQPLLHTLSVPLLAVLAAAGAWAQGSTPPPALFAPSAPPTLTVPAPAAPPAAAASAAAAPVATPVRPATPVVPSLLAPARPASAPSLPVAAKPAPAASASRIAAQAPAAPARKDEPPKAAAAAQAPKPKSQADGRGRSDAPVINAATRASLAESQNFAENPGAMPVIGKGGKVMFAFGDSIPTVMCAPLRVCDVELEPGENIQGAPHIGDSVRWRISPAVSFEGDLRVIHLVIKATAPDLDTNLIVPTDRRTYYLRLVSSEDRFVSRVAFEYPEDTKAWLKVQPPPPPPPAPVAARPVVATPVPALVATPVAVPAVAAVPVDDLPSVALSKLRFDYQVTVATGNPKFKPVRVMDDGSRVFITMADNMSVDEAPVLFVIAPDGSEQLVNYRLRGNIFIIDRLADKLALVSGSGSGQQRVDISRGVCDRSGWFHKCAMPATAGGPGN